MVVTCRPRPRVVLEERKVVRRQLLSSHVRVGGEPTPYSCPICLCLMPASSDHCPSWARATCCGQVWHEACLHRYVLTNTAVDDPWYCPNCKEEHTIDALDEFDPAEVIERLFPEEDKAYVPPDEGEEEEEASERRCTRSMGPPPPVQRRLRSSKTYY